ncbi:MAG: thiosulfate sulfurtransferase GlpE [Pseudomonadales bacterium]|nr:thiosulfate sulfurtransferase GlpE [Pseudomonadales bacterium]
MFTRISTTDAQKLIKDSQAQVVDIRDPQAFSAGHMPAAINLNNDNMQSYIDNADTQKPLLVCCYHGNSSQGAADFLNAEKGFKDVYSIDGGFEAWKLAFDVEA